MLIEIPVWPYVYGSPSGTGNIRMLPDDFTVHETLAFEPSGNGEHVFLQVRKRSENTEFIARQLAKFANVSLRDVGYAGLKDRHAVTTQWFSVWLPGKPEPDWAGIINANLEILQAVRHNRKLKRGALSGNRFEITVRDWQGDEARIINQLAAIKTNGIANYYGEQRFGHHGQNVNKALAMFKGEKIKREQRGLYLSAVRSFLFNQILGERIAAGNWNQALAGDCYLFDRSKAYFKSSLPDEEILSRLTTGAIHPSGALWGKGETSVSANVFAIEQEVIDRYPELAHGLVDYGVELARRALRVNIEGLDWQFSDQTTLRISFALPAGCYATSVLRELIASNSPNS